MKFSARPIISRPGWRPPRRSLTKHGSRNAARPNTLGGIADSFKKASIRCNRLRSIIFSLTALNDRTTRPIGYFQFDRRFPTCLGNIRWLKTKSDGPAPNDPLADFLDRKDVWEGKCVSVHEY